MRARHLGHLAKRFMTSLSLAPLSEVDEAWARRHLGRGERRIWDQMDNPDRRHAVGVARAVADHFGPDPDREVVAAALLHDSGKVISGLSTTTRVVATLFWAVAPDDLARRWASGASPSFALRLGQYRLHPELGGDLLDAAGADELTSAWAREHHRPEDQWSIPVDVARVLKACDDD